MSAPFTVHRCARCGYAAYPPRIACPRCGGTEWRRRLADAGVVEEVTVRRPVTKHRQLPWGNWIDQAETRLAEVRTDLGPVVICRVGEGVRRGMRVRLEAQASTAIALPGQQVEARPLAPGEGGAAAPEAATGGPLPSAAEAP